MKFMHILLVMLCISALLYIGSAQLIPTREQPQTLMLTPSSEYVFAFDLHGVVFTNDWQSMWQEFKKAPFTFNSLLTFLNPFFLHQFFSLFFHSDSWEEIILKILKQYPDLERYWPTLLIALNKQSVIPGTIDIINNLKAQGYQLYVFSNIGEQSFKQLQTFHPHIFEPFNGFVYTQADDGWIQKPQKAAYQKFLKKFNLQHAQVVLIDDKDVNIQAAEEMGFHTIHFTSPEQLQKDLIPYVTPQKQHLVTQPAM